MKADSDLGLTRNLNVRFSLRLTLPLIGSSVGVMRGTKRLVSSFPEGECPLLAESGRWRNDRVDLAAPRTTMGDTVKYKESGR
jgi:hypothetical protein